MIVSRLACIIGLLSGPLGVGSCLVFALPVTSTRKRSRSPSRSIGAMIRLIGMGADFGSSWDSEVVGVGVGDSELDPVGVGVGVGVGVSVGVGWGTKVVGRTVGTVTTS